MSADCADAPELTARHVTQIRRDGARAWRLYKSGRSSVNEARRSTTMQQAGTPGGNYYKTRHRMPERMLHTTEFLRRPVPETVSWALTRFTRLITGAQARWLGCAPVPVQRIYFGNHNSHADFALIWASLPVALRRMTRPVAGADYWEAGALKRYIIHEVLRGVVIARSREERSEEHTSEL